MSDVSATRRQKMDATTFFAGIALKAMIDMRQYLKGDTPVDEKDAACKEAWEWAHVMTCAGRDMGYINDD